MRVITRMYTFRRLKGLSGEGTDKGKRRQKGRREVGGSKKDIHFNAGSKLSSQPEDTENVKRKGREEKIGSQCGRQASFFSLPTQVLEMRSSSIANSKSAVTY